MMAFLASINSKDECAAAACVAALVGNRNAHDSLNLAKDRFRSISFDQLDENDFIKSKEDANAQNTLFSRTEDAKLGRCDAFMSHSWYDDGHKKFAALKQ